MPRKRHDCAAVGHASVKFLTSTFTITCAAFSCVGVRWIALGRVGVMAGYCQGALGLAALALILSATPVEADTFQQMWMGRIARPPADNEEASVYWEDKWDARGKRFKPNEVSCAHRTEAFGTIFVVTNLDNGKKINCPVQDRGPFANGRVLDFSLGAAREIGCDGLCRVTIRRAGYE